MFWRGVLGYLPANLVQGVVGLLTIVAFTRLLTPEAYGVYALAFSVMSLVHTCLFVWLEAPAGWRTGRAFADELLQRHRVRVLPGDLFGPSGARHIRVSYVADDGRLDEGLNRMAELVRGERRPVRMAA